MNYFEVLKAVWPETAVVGTAFLVLLVDLTAMRARALGTRTAVAATLATLGGVVALLLLGGGVEARAFGGGVLVIDGLTQLLKAALVLLAVFTALLSAEARFTEHVGEFFALLLLATAAMMFLVSTEDLLMIFVSLETTSLSLYILTAFNKRNLQSAEAALKYFLFGGVAAAFTLFGISLLYGLADSTNLRAISEAVRSRPVEPLLYVALVMTLIGFGFKIAAVPFHLWAPDAYQGAPTPAAALIASGSKVASFFVLAKLAMVGFHGVEGSAAWRQYAPGWLPIVAVLAALSMILGNLAAIAQKSVRRLIAYSAVAHAGYVLVGLMSDNGQGVSSVIFYTIIYGLTTVGAFGVIAIAQEQTGDDSFAAFAGLRQRAPLASVAMLVFMLSLAGIPPLAGFFGKFYLFAAAVNADPQNLGLLWLVILGIAMSAVSLYYYLQVLKQIFVVEAPVNAARLKPALPTQVAVALLAVTVVLLGCAPNLLLGRILAGVRTASF